MRIIKMTRGYVTEVDDEDYDWLSVYAWSAASRDFRARTGWLNESGRLETRYMSRMIWENHYGDIPEGMVIDHEDQRVRNNQKENLRLLTKSQNGFNCKRYKSNNRYRGVQPNRKKWRASIHVDSILYHIGIFDTEKKAAQAYDKRCLEIRGEYAKLNFPEKKH